MRIVLAIGIALASASMAQAQHNVGDKVVVIADTELKVEGQTVDDAWPGLVLRVRAVNGNLLWVSNGKPGWLDAVHVAPLDRRAIDRLTEMIRAEPANAQRYRARAHVWENLGDLDDAIGDLNEAIRLDSSAESYNNRGHVWKVKGEFDKAIADYSQALRLDPESPMAYNNRGNAWFAKEEYDKAIADFSQALRLDPKYAFAYKNRGDAWSANGEYEKAITDYGAALQLDPKYASAYTERGWRWIEKKEYDKGLADFNEAVRLDPNEGESWNARAWLRATCSDERFRDGKQAVADATKACELSKWKDAEYLDTLAAAYAESGKFEKAVEWQSKALDGVSEDEKADYQSRLDLFKAGKQYRE
jgi:tetratricopeptide (TPR) repeat protein